MTTTSLNHTTTPHFHLHLPNSTPPLFNTLNNNPKMSSRIPTSTSVTESAVISAPFSSVWHLIKLESFSTFWTALTSSSTVKGVSPDTDIVKWVFKDGTELEVKLEAHSVRLTHWPRGLPRRSFSRPLRVVQREMEGSRLKENVNRKGDKDC